MLQSVISYMLSRAANWDIQTAMQWLTGSLNNASLGAGACRMAIAAVVVVPLHARPGPRTRCAAARRRLGIRRSVCASI